MLSGLAMFFGICSELTRFAEAFVQGVMHQFCCQCQRFKSIAAPPAFFFSVSLQVWD
jgi:hypothetical protein